MNRINVANFLVLDKAKRRVHCHSHLFISQLIDRADRKLFKLIQLNRHCLNPYFSVLAFQTPGIPLDPVDISSFCSN